MRSALRREMRMRRRAMAPVRRQLATRAIVRHLRSLPAYRRAKRIALYWPADGEPDVHGLAGHARQHGKELYLPVVAHGGVMSFVPWNIATTLRRNRYGIPEPFGGRQRVSASRLDLLIIPLVAFDAHGNRLGMGGGYYDRALASRRHRPFLVGVAFALQQTPELQVQPWDVPLDLVITERGARAARRMRAEASHFGEEN